MPDNVQHSANINGDLRHGRVDGINAALVHSLDPQPIGAVHGRAPDRAIFRHALGNDDGGFPIHAHADFIAPQVRIRDMIPIHNNFIALRHGAEVLHVIGRVQFAAQGQAGLLAGCGRSDRHGHFVSSADDQPAFNAPLRACGHRHLCPGRHAFFAQPHVPRRRVAAPGQANDRMTGPVLAGGQPNFSSPQIAHKGQGNTGILFRHIGCAIIIKLRHVFQKLQPAALIGRGLHAHNSESLFGAPHFAKGKLAARLRNFGQGLEQREHVGFFLLRHAHDVSVVPRIDVDMLQLAGVLHAGKHGHGIVKGQAAVIRRQQAPGSATLQSVDSQVNRIAGQTVDRLHAGLK